MVEAPKRFSRRLLSFIMTLIVTLTFGVLYEVGHEEGIMLGMNTTASSKQNNDTLVNSTTRWTDSSSSFSPSMTMAPLTKWPINEENFRYCQQHNFVRNRLDAYVDDHATKEHRPYSISPQTFQALASSSSHDNKHVCQSVNDTVQAIANGHRLWLNDSHTKLTSLEKEQFPSYFVPANCTLPVLSQHELCAAMDQYQHVITIGDSLTRHLRQAMFMALSDDLVAGGMRHPKQRDNPRDFYKCRCDGQFSEHKTCRAFDTPFWESTDPSQVHVCSHLPLDDGYSRFRFSSEWNDALLQTKCSAGQAEHFRGILLVLQGGAHHGSIAQKFIQKELAPLFSKPGFQTCVQHNHVNIVWTTFNAQSHSLDARYRHQSQTSAMAFNRDMQAFFDQQPFPVTTLDVFNLTKDSQTSDGFHHLSDVNLLKVHFLLHLANRIKAEQQQQQQQQQPHQQQQQQAPGGHNQTQ